MTRDIDPAVIMEPDGFFRAIDRNNYDVDCDHTGFFSNSPIGRGRTPLDAIVDLLDSAEPQCAADGLPLSRCLGVSCRVHKRCCWQ